MWLSLGNQASVCTLSLTEVLANPNLGKTCFLFYLLLRLLSEEKSVAFQANSVFVLFQSTGVSLYDNTSLTGPLIPHGSWALSDSRVRFELPCDAFLTASRGRNAWIVQTASPSERRWSLWLKEHKGDIYWMDVPTLEDVIALG